MELDYDRLVNMRRQSAAWRLLAATNAPLLLSFFNKVFVEHGIRSIASSDLIERLDDELFALNERLGPRTFPQSAEAYLADWADPARGWLRKYYPPGSDEPHYDATVAVDKAVSWVRSLQERSFVGTESRLSTIFDLLRQMAFGAESDPTTRLAELMRRRNDIDREIERVEAGEVDVLDGSALRDRYQQVTATAHDLLTDFREVEANFRELDRELRRRIALWDGSKGELLDEVLESRESIARSDQGRSFQAFYDFLLTPSRREELKELLAAVETMEAIGEPDPRMRRMPRDWLEAAERTQSTVRQLSEQLRRFLDDRMRAEDRRVMELMRGIEAHALALRDVADVELVAQIDPAAPVIRLLMERPLYAPVAKAAIDSTGIQAGDDEFAADALFEAVYVDPARLTAGIHQALGTRSQVSLSELVHDHPLEQGLAELVAYLTLSDDHFTTVFDDSRQEDITWVGGDDVRRVASVPVVTYARTSPGIAWADTNPEAR
ncbi:DUF3375 domain-containing protein [Streptomyces murinus]